jgi:hypothetical protein
VIVVVLGIVWVVALIPMVFRWMSDRQFSPGVRPRNGRFWRRGSSSVDSPGSVGASVPGATLGFSAAAQRLHEERGGAYVSSAPPLASSVAAPPELIAPAPSSATLASTGASPAIAARRRRVVAVLVGANLLFFLGGIVPAARILWDMGLLSLGCTAAYGALLIHFHRLSVERAQKVVALQTRRHVTAALESRRHVIAVDRARQSAVGGAYGAGEYATGRYPARAYATAGYGSGGFPSGSYVNAGTSYAGSSEPLLSGSGWSMIGTQRDRVTRR